MSDHKRENTVDPRDPAGQPKERTDKHTERPLRQSSEQYSKDATDRDLMPIGSTLEKGKPTVP
jgi:hypothetical protein